MTALADPIADALHRLRMSGVFYCVSELTAPWALALPPMPRMLMFHVLTDGRAWLLAPGQDPVPMRVGDLVLLPHGSGHVLASDPDVPPVDLDDAPREQLTDRYEVLRLDGGGDPARVVCGAVEFGEVQAHRLLAALPPVVSSPAADAAPLLQRMSEETRTLRLGGEVVVARLADILVVSALRDFLVRQQSEQGDAGRGWLAALRDPDVGRALAAVHEQPGHPWTLVALARAAGMSRSAFAARFCDLVGVPPMQYVAEWRMDCAVRALRETDVVVAALADRLGYRSEAAFSRAFSRVMGTTPGAVRRTRAVPLPLAADRA